MNREWVDTPDHPVLAERGSFAHMPLGRADVTRDSRTLRLAHYIDRAALPAAPDVDDLTAAVASWPMYGNDHLTDCTCACAGHMVQAWTANAGSLVTPADQAILDLFWATGSDDNGRSEIDVLNRWRQAGLGEDKITAYALVDSADHELTRIAHWLFGGIYAGVALPISAQGQQVWDVVGDGKTGDSAPGSWGGHAIPWLAYNANGWTVTVDAVTGKLSWKTVTWGAVLEVTEPFRATYTEEQYAIVTADWIANASQLAPSGVAIGDLLSDLAKVGQVQQ